MQENLVKDYHSVALLQVAVPFWKKVCKLIPTVLFPERAKQAAD